MQSKGLCSREAENKGKTRNGEDRVKCQGTLWNEERRHKRGRGVLERKGGTSHTSFFQ